ncbi:TerB family tellurite resistance protein [Aliarcobacter butzleri]|uniref:TerB family tellurite resistance protein n=1 Tax=Aliarcobacter butzleri TaxID=28197 RepID=UPI00125FC602|nr:TerB family tellurite resistance protein [Aliarcobacter butzleri]MCT7579288.1 TerB family tellurite resistance protein [Aliarcobacter butzleri]
MLLMKLQSKEKFSFLQLAHYLARIDNNFGKREEEIILEYCTEMGIENLDSFDMENFSLENILKDFKSEASKRIVILELMILIHIDHNFNINEQILIEKISKSFGIDVKDVNDYSQWGKSVAMLYEVAKIFINEEKVS